MKHISRKDFLKNAGMGAVGIAVLGSSISAIAAEEAESAAYYESRIDWAAEYDVVVIGSGLAGLCAAAVAAEAGSKVLIVEKAPLPLRGGNSRVACGATFNCTPENREGLSTYIKNVCQGFITPGADMIDAFTTMCIDAPEWLNARGGNVIGTSKGAGAYREFEGYDALDFQIANRRMYDAGLFNPLMCYVEEHENVDIWYSAKADEFVQDPETRVVHGVKVIVDEEVYAVRALNGVCLCSGGFEANQEMIQHYLHLPYAYPKGTTYNTGDGHKMAMQVGADLWHMSNISGPDLDVVDPVTNTGNAGGVLRMRGYSRLYQETSGFTLQSAIIVGADGTRFLDESYLPDHGYMNFHGRKIISPYSLPAYVIFDAEAAKKPIYPIWEDNEKKVEEGLIKKADTLEELTAMLGLPEGSLVATVEKYNGLCAQGEDIFFGRAPEYLIPLSENGPYYGVEVKPTFVNTQGGPRRNVDAQIVDVKGEPIPHLYGAGECGSMWSDIYPGGGNLTECVAFGRIAGANAAASKDDNYRGSLMGDKTPVDFTVTLPHFKAEADNEYVGVGFGIGGKIFTKIVVDGDKMTDIQVLHNFETPGIGSVAIARIPGRVLEAQSIEVDSVVGATATSRAIKDSILDAMTQAGLVK